MRKLHILLISIGFLVACDPTTYNLYYVDNQSDHAINVNCKTPARCTDRVIDTLIIVPSMQQQFILDISSTGYAKDDGIHFLMCVDTIYFTINDTLLIKKDCLERTNWNFQIIDGHEAWGSGGDAIYTFALENKDITIARK